MELNQNIQHLRREANLSQQDVAERIGVTRSAVTQWESGTSQPRMGMLYKLAQALGTTPSALVDYKRPLLGGICVPANVSLVSAEGHTEGKEGELSTNGNVGIQIEVPNSVLAAHPRVRFISMEASYLNPLLPGMLSIVYDPYAKPTYGDLVIVRTGLNRHELRRWQLSEMGIPIHNPSLNTIEYDSDLDQAYPLPLGIVCWYQPSSLVA